MDTGDFGKPLFAVFGNTEPSAADLIRKARAQIRLSRLSPATERTYLSSIRKFARFVTEREGLGYGAESARLFLEDLHRGEESASLQRAATAATRFLLREVLQDEGEIGSAIVAPGTVPLPVVFSREEIVRLLAQLDGTYRVMASLMYGSGLRVQECLALRILDLDFAGKTVIVRDTQGEETRRTILPQSLHGDLKGQFERSRRLYEQDLRVRRLRLPTPAGLPLGDTPWKSFWLFPSERVSRGSLLLPRRHLQEDGVQRAIKAAIANASLPPDGSCQSLRHSFATHLLEENYDLKVVQKLLGHVDIRSTAVYLELARHRRFTVPSPLDTIRSSAQSA